MAILVGMPSLFMMRLDKHAWKKARYLALLRDSFQCVECSATSQLSVDHIQPLETHFELAYQLSNLQTLCHDCHVIKTNKQRRGQLDKPVADVKDWWST